MGAYEDYSGYLKENYEVQKSKALENYEVQKSKALETLESGDDPLRRQYGEVKEAAQTAAGNTREALNAWYAKTIDEYRRRSEEPGVSGDGFLEPQLGEVGAQVAEMQATELGEMEDFAGSTSAPVIQETGDVSVLLSPADLTEINKGLQGISDAALASLREMLDAYESKETVQQEPQKIVNVTQPAGWTLEGVLEDVLLPVVGLLLVLDY